MEINNQIPYNIDIEISILGSILKNNQILENVEREIFPELFYSSANKELFNLITKLIEKGHIANINTLSHYVENNELFNELGGKKFLVEIVSSVASIVNINDLINILYDFYEKRELSSICENINQRIYKNDIDTNSIDLIEEAEQHLYKLAETGSSSNSIKTLKDANKIAIEQIYKASQTKGGISGIPTGFINLDKNMGGLQKSDLLILAARPAMGKTALAVNVAFNVAKHIRDNETSGSVLFSSLEMSAEQLSGRIISSHSEIPSDRLRKGNLSEDEFIKINSTSKEIETLPLFIDDTPSITIANLRQRARRLKRKHGLSLIVVDYIQLITPSKLSGDSRVNQVSDITRGLKMIAKELDVPVIALSQLSRSVESREDKKPILSDLRESGSIEQDADIVMFIYREEYYLSKTYPEQRPNETPEKFDERCRSYDKRLKESHNKAQLNIAKQRHGPTTVITLHFNGQYTKFGNYYEDEE